MNASYSFLMQSKFDRSVYIFDLFGVVISFDDSLVSKRIARHCEAPEIALRELQDIVSTRQLITGAMSLSDLYEDIRSKHGLNQGYDGFLAEWKKPYSEPMPGIENLIDTLSRNAKLVLLSNVDAHYWPTIEERHPIVNRFDHKVLSFDCGMAKPDPEIYAYTERAAGFLSADCLFLDDKMENIEAAEKRGWSGHCFTSVAAFMNASATP